MMFCGYHFVSQTLNTLPNLGIEKWFTHVREQLRPGRPAFPSSLQGRQARSFFLQALFDLTHFALLTSYTPDPGAHSAFH